MPLTLLQGNSRCRFPSVTIILRCLFLSAIAALVMSCNVQVFSYTSTVTEKESSDDYTPRVKSLKYQASGSCMDCHTRIYEQFAESMHSKSFENQIVKEVFRNILLPRTKNNNTLGEEVRACIACHSPPIFLGADRDFPSPKNGIQRIPGVECDICHTITGFKGEKPGNGNYISKPSAQKLGPFQYEDDHHRSSSELHTKSEFCAICHNRTNRYGLEIISTFSEWQESQFGQGEVVGCQDCHMNVQGLLTAAKPKYESGRAADGTLIDPKERSKLYSHRFPGAHSESQLVGAVTLAIQVDDSEVKAGKVMMVYVEINNSKSGHKLPTGSAELRLLYLDLTAEIGGKTVHIGATSLDRDMFDVAGKGKFDTEILGEDILPGSRVYRAICIDPQGRQTLFSFDAQKMVFDNRLEAGEIRKEFFMFQVPDEVGLEFTLVARLNYLRYPGSLADKLGISKAKYVELASVRKNVLAHF